MQMTNEDARYLAALYIGPQELMLSAFTAVEQPDFCPLRQSQRQAGDVPRERRDPGAGSKKCELQGTTSPFSQCR